MIKSRRLPRVWLMGLCNFTQGAYWAVMLLTLPQLLAASGVPEPQIASVTATGMIPSFCSFLLAPILDWRFSRRTYAILLAGLCTLAVFGALMSLQDLGLLTFFMFLGGAAAVLYYAALGGWFGSLIAGEEQSRLGAWFTVANMTGGGVTAIIAIYLLRSLPFQISATLVAVIMIAPLPVLAWTPATPADGRLASESFRAFFRDVLALLQKRSILWTLLLFAMPAASFALTNTLGGLGRDFDASEQFVGIVLGAGVGLAGIVGSLIIPPIIRWVPPRALYLLIGSFGALFTLMLAALPRTPVMFAVAVLGENASQSAAFAVESTIILRTIGHGNPLAATQYALLAAAPSFPITYMQAIDGAAYGVGGLTGSFFADATISLTACGILALLFGLSPRPESDETPQPEINPAR